VESVARRPPLVPGGAKLTGGLACHTILISFRGRSGCGPPGYGPGGPGRPAGEISAWPTSMGRPLGPGVRSF